MISKEKNNPPGGILVRDFWDEDFSSVTELWEETGLTDPERDDTLDSIRATLSSGGRLLVLEMSGIKGVIGSSWMTCDGRRTYLHHFCIHPDYREMGLGTMLVEKSLEWIRQKGLQVKLEVHKENVRAKKLYEKAGFFAFTDYDIYMKRDV